MAKSLRLSGKFNAEEAKIIKDFMEKHYHFQTPNQLVRESVFEFIEAANIVEMNGSQLEEDFDLSITLEKTQLTSEVLRKKKKVGRPRIKKKRGRPKT
tara:strand:+ start:506 stop:799 length:294 start_codon:yes stop_codon:yes gene_type:complete